MKVALITIWHCGNYGAEMQAYATVKALQRLGHEVEVIDYRLYEHSNTLRSQLGLLMRSVTPSEIIFKKFWRRCIPSGRHYKNLSQLRECPPQADVYMVGSDQVWNEDIVGRRIAAYLLDFGSESVKRISYASSIGISTWSFSNQFSDFMAHQLHKFSAISCREKTGANLLEKHLGLNVQNVLDPTLLHQEYKEITGNIEETNTLAYYPLSKNDTMSMCFCQDLANKLNLKLVNANPCTFIPFISVAWRRNSVKQWLRTLGSAQLVVTGSFHGLAFSLIYHRQFIIINNGKQGRNSRISDLLDYIGLSHRLFTSVEAAMNSDVWNERIDYAVVDEKIEKARGDSLNYLKETLS